MTLAEGGHFGCRVRRLGTACDRAIRRKNRGISEDTKPSLQCLPCYGVLIGTTGQEEVGTRVWPLLTGEPAAVESPDMYIQRHIGSQEELLAAEESSPNQRSHKADILTRSLHCVLGIVWI